MVVREKQVKSILSPSKVYDYALNPYVGCEHACAYCYARFMRRFTGHREPWGEFVDVKTNAPDLLRREIMRKPVGTVWVSGVCDPYQPLERQYRLTRQCLEILVENQWPICVQTRSPLVLRDLDVLRLGSRLEVGFTITTGDDEIRRLFEPRASSVQERLEGLAVLHEAGIKTFAMIAPILPGAEKLPKLLAGKVDHILVDRLNYDYGNWVYKQHELEYARTDAYFESVARELAADCARLGIPCRVVF
ncbi:MAG: radical SAM protein [Thermoleophilia bacterium]|nr:radical SAM protein [Thermoleophilia bacterium]